MRVRLERGWAVLLSCALLAPSITFAGDNKADSDRLFGQGLRLFEQKDFSGARQMFADAYAKYPSPNSLLNLARSEQLSSHCIDAIAHYRAYIALPDNPRISAGDRGSAHIKLSECLSKVGRIQVNAPPTAHVAIDGLAVTWRPGETFDVTPGDHKVDLSVEGASKTRTATASEGQVASVQWEDPAPPPPPPPEVKPPPPEVKPPPPPEVTPPPPVVVTPPPPPPPPPQEWKRDSHWPTGKLAGAVALGVASIGSFIAAPSLLAASLSAARAGDALSTQLGPSGCAGASAMSPNCVSLAGDRNSQSSFGVASAIFWVLGPLFAAGAIAVVAAVPNVHPLVTAMTLRSNGFSIRF
jgi:hypothetical protein